VPVGAGRYFGQFGQVMRKPQWDVARRIDETWETDGIFERLCMKLIDDRRYADYFARAGSWKRRR
jgi:hypothetical protein